MGLIGSGEIVNCRACGAPYDASRASWCSCIGQERTLVCPSCQSCFCRAPREYQQRFWSVASFWLRDAHQKAVDEVPRIKPNPPPGAVSRPMVLVVEDQAAVLRLAVRAMEGLGLGVIHAQDGPGGLEMARQYQPEVVVCDALLPGLDGRELCRTLKSGPRPPAVVVMSGVYTSTRHAGEGRTLYRADDYLAKPFRFTELQDVVRRHVGTDRRSGERFPVHLTVLLERQGENLHGDPSEITVTDNLGYGGAEVRTTLPVAVAEVVDLRQLSGRFRAQAVVRHVSIGPGGQPRLHLQFRTVVGLDGVLPAGSPT